jgi:type II secretory pathway component HofQ
MRAKRRILMIRTQPVRKASFFVRRIAPLVVLTAAVAITPTVPAFAEGGIYSGAPISLELIDADLQQLLTTFSEMTDFVFAVDAQAVEMGGLDHLVTVDYKSIPWDQALDEILIASGLTWTLEGKVLWIHLPKSGPGGDRNFTGDAINLRLEDAKLTDVLRSLAKVTGLGIEFDPDIEATISVALRSVPWDQVLDLILRISGFSFTQEGNGIEVFEVSDAKGMQLVSASAISDEGDDS